MTREATAERATEAGFTPRHVVNLPVFGAEWEALLAAAGLTPSAASPLAGARSGSGHRPPRPSAVCAWHKGPDKVGDSLLTPHRSHVHQQAALAQDRCHVLARHRSTVEQFADFNTLL